MWFWFSLWSKRWPLVSYIQVWYTIHLVNCYHLHNSKDDNLCHSYKWKDYSWSPIETTPPPTSSPNGFSSSESWRKNHNFSKVNICIFMQQFRQRPFFRTLQNFTRLLWQKSRDEKYTLLVSKHWKYFVERVILIAVFIFTIISCVIMYFLVILYHCFVFVVHIMWVIFVFVGHTCSCICGSYLPLCFALHFYLGSHWLVYL